MPFWNPNGIFQECRVFGAEIHIYRSGCKKTQIQKLKLGIDIVASELSKTGLRMFLGPLDRFLEFHMAPIPFGKIRQNPDFYQN